MKRNAYGGVHRARWNTDEEGRQRCCPPVQVTAFALGIVGVVFGFLEAGGWDTVYTIHRNLGITVLALGTAQVCTEGVVALFTFLSGGDSEKKKLHILPSFNQACTHFKISPTICTLPPPCSPPSLPTHYQHTLPFPRQMTALLWRPHKESGQPVTTARTVWTWVHRSLGLSAALLAIANIY